MLLLAAVVHAAWMYDGPVLLLTLKKEKAEGGKARMLLYMMGEAWAGIGPSERILTASASDPSANWWRHKLPKWPHVERLF